MTSHQNFQPGNTAAADTAGQALVLPTLAQALIYLAYGLFTAFVQDPTIDTARYATALFMFALGVNTVLTGRRVGANYGQARQVLTSAGIIVAVAAPLLLVNNTGLFRLVLIISVALGLSSLLKALFTTVGAGGLPIARD